MSQAKEIEDLLSHLTLHEKVELLSGIGACTTASNQRLNIPSLETSDGPHGLRGGQGRFFNPPPGYQLPSATGLGATFDTGLLKELGQLTGDEGRRKGVQVALAPTVCLQRSPLLGRGFEAYGEDPILSGTLAAEFITGLQEKKVGACIKHYAAHDQSLNSKEDDCLMTQRTLREVHLLPFQIAMARSKPWSFMTAYQKINGLHVSEDPFLIQKVLREEWKFEGLILSDWWGTYSTSESINAGMDIEMPGPTIWRGKRLEEAVACRKVSVQTIEKSVTRLLELIYRTGAGTKQTPPEGTGEDTPKSRTLIRKAAADSIVLLKNERGILPLKGTETIKYGFIGEHFDTPATCGGGSSEVMPFYICTPREAMSEVLGIENIRFAPGCNTRKWTPLIATGLFQPESDKPGLSVEWFAEDPSKNDDLVVLNATTTTSTSLYFSQLKLENVPNSYYVQVKGTFIPEETCRYRFSLCARGRARFFVDGKEKIELWVSHPPKSGDTPCFNTMSMERFAELDVKGGQRYELEILMTNIPIQGPSAAGGVRLGGAVVQSEDAEIDKAVALAKEVDIPIIITGSNSEFESEALDRTSLLLPLRENEMITRVCEANPNTIVVIQAGMPVSMPWLHLTSTVVHTWFGGQEVGHALADVLFGKVNPSGRLPITFPKRIEDTPAFLNFGKTDRQIAYGEGVFIGSRYYEMIDKDPLFWFGFGLSYTSFQYCNFSVPESVDGSEHLLVNLSVEVTNTGSCDGAEVIQVFVGDLDCSVQRPKRELKAFKKVFIKSKTTQLCSFTLDKYALSFWSEEFDKWRAESGGFAIILARSANPKDEISRKTMYLKKTFMWSGV